MTHERSGIGRAARAPGARAFARGALGMVLVATLTPGCGTYITSCLLDEVPTEAEIAKLAPQDRAGLMCQVAHMDKNLRSELPAFVASLEKARVSGYVQGIVRLAYLPEPLPGGKGVKPVVNLVSIRGGGKNPLEPGLLWGLDLEKARSHVSDLTLEALQQARRKSAFHAPVEARLAKVGCVAIGDIFFLGGKWYRTLEIHSGPPGGAASVVPARVFVLAEKDKDGGWHERDTSAVFAFRGGMYHGLTARHEAGRLVSVTADEWSPNVDDVIAGRTAGLLNVMTRKEAITYLSDFLLTWKTKGMPARLRGMSPAELEEFAINIEKSVLKYDMESKRWKDAAQAKIVAGASADADLEIARLLDQRKTLLTAILITTKKVLAVRRRTR